MDLLPKMFNSSILFFNDNLVLKPILTVFFVYQFLGLTDFVS